MRKISLVISLFCALTLTGCATGYNLSEQETGIVAESMAGLLLKYDSNYRKQSLLVPVKELEEETIPTDEETVTSDNTTAENGSDESSNTEGKSDETVQKYTLSEVIGFDDFEVLYEGYNLYNSYPDDTSSTYFSLTPREGNQLLAISFKARNLTKEKKDFNLIKSGIKFKLLINEKTTYVPLLTLLENDLQYINIPIEGNETEDVILVFEVLKEDIASAQLNVIKDTKEVNILMK
jgi:hypothetical protein